MKLEKLIKKVGSEGVEIEVFTGRDWNGKRFYLHAPKGAYVDYKANKYYKSNYDKKGVELNKWFDSWSNTSSFKIMYRLIKEEGEW